MIDTKKVVGLLFAQWPPSRISAHLSCHVATIYRIKKNINNPIKERKKGSGRPRSAMTPKAIKSVREKIRRNPIRSMRKMANEVHVSEKTVRRIVKNVLKSKSRSRTKRHLITERIKILRLERSKHLRSILRKGAAIILFTDEKIFTVDAALNTKNDRYISQKRPEEVDEKIKFSFRTKHPSSVMMFGLISSDGKKMPPVFVEKGLKLDSKAYIEILNNYVKPWIESNYNPEQNFIFQQDGAPCHTSKLTQDWLSKNIPNFWNKNIWPPSSPDLNPLDYSIWAKVEALANQSSHASSISLMKSIRKVWASLDETYIKNVCASFRPRLEKVIQQEGAHIE